LHQPGDRGLLGASLGGSLGTGFGRATRTRFGRTAGTGFRRATRTGFRSATRTRFRSAAGAGFGRTASTRFRRAASTGFRRTAGTRFSRTASTCFSRTAGTCFRRAAGTCFRRTASTRFSRATGTGFRRTASAGFGGTPGTGFRRALGRTGRRASRRRQRFGPRTNFLLDADRGVLRRDEALRRHDRAARVLADRQHAGTDRGRDGHRQHACTDDQGALAGTVRLFAHAEAPSGSRRNMDPAVVGRSGGFVPRVGHCCAKYARCGRKLAASGSGQRVLRNFRHHGGHQPLGRVLLRQGVERGEQPAGVGLALRDVGIGGGEPLERPALVGRRLAVEDEVDQAVGGGGHGRFRITGPVSGRRGPAAGP